MWKWFADLMARTRSRTVVIRVQGHQVLSQTVAALTRAHDTQEKLMDTPLSDTPESEAPVESVPDEIQHDHPELQQDEQGESDWSEESKSDDRLSDEVRQELGLTDPEPGQCIRSRHMLR